jgi:integrase
MTRAGKTKPDQKRAPKTDWGKIKKLPSGKYWAGEPLGDGKYLPAPNTFTSKSAARSWLNKRREAREEGEQLDADVANSTVGFWIDRWLKGKKDAWNKGRVSPKAYAAYEQNTRNWVNNIKIDGKPLRDVKIRKVNTEVIEEIQETLATMTGPRGRTSPAQAHKAELNLYSVCKLAAAKGAIPQNPFRDDAVYVTDYVSHRELFELTPEMVTEIADQIPLEYRAAVFLWAYSGLRSGEAWGLQLRDINMLHSRVSVHRALVSTPDQLIRDKTHTYKLHEAHQIGPCGNCSSTALEIPFDTKIRTGVALRPPKNGRRRDFDMQRFVADEVMVHLERRQPKSAQDWLFVDHNGLPVNHGNFYAYIFKPLMRVLELPESIVVHTLRHFCGAYHLGLGYPWFVVQEMLGHSNEEMTRLYAHLMPGLAAKWHEQAEAEYAGRVGNVPTTESTTELRKA